MNQTIYVYKKVQCQPRIFTTEERKVEALFKETNLTISFTAQNRFLILKIRFKNFTNNNPKFKTKPFLYDKQHCTLNEGKGNSKGNGKGQFGNSIQKSSDRERETHEDPGGEGVRGSTIGEGIESDLGGGVLRLTER